MCEIYIVIIVIRQLGCQMVPKGDPACLYVGGQFFLLSSDGTKRKLGYTPTIKSQKGCYKTVTLRKFSHHE